MLLIQLSAAHGPAECEYALALTLRELLKAAARDGIAVDVVEKCATPAGCRSALLRSEGERAARWFEPWVGSIQWVFTSPFRAHHKRRNWFVAVQACPLPPSIPEDGEIIFRPCKASGRGGQHVNTTDSAVHATHVASGIAVKVMAERSQHANRRLARQLLALKLAERNAQGQDDAKRARSLQHWAVERGRPVKMFYV